MMDGYLMDILEKEHNDGRGGLNPLYKYSKDTHPQIGFTCNQQLNPQTNNT